MAPNINNTPATSMLFPNEISPFAINTDLKYTKSNKTNAMKKSWTIFHKEGDLNIPNPKRWIVK